MELMFSVRPMKKLGKSRMTTIMNARGASLIAAIFIIVILAFMGVMFVTLIGTGSFTAVNDMQSAQALYVAEGGLERTIRFLDSPILDPVNTDRRRACANVTGDPALTDVALGQGLFRVVTEAGSPFYPLTAVTLNGLINTLVTTIPVNADPIASGYAPYGRIMIDREIIDYSGTTANSFTGAVRGRDGSAAAAHANLTRVGQYQCMTTSTGGIPDLTAPRAQRAVREGIQLQEGWAVGAGGNILRWQQTGWSLYGVVVAQQLNGISMLSYADGWAIGDPGGIAAQRPLVLRYTNGAWASQNTGLGINRSLHSIYCIGSNDCWAVGDQGNAASNQRPWIVQYNGVWSNINTGNTANAPLRSIFCPATGNCWAVGDSVGGFELVYQLAGGVWVRQVNNANIPTQDLMSVFCTSATECFVVGAAGTSSRWTIAGGWTNVSPGGNQLNSVFMLDTTGDGVADDGWAVGDRRSCVNPGATIMRWNGVNWACLAAADLSALPDRNLNSVFCVDSNDCWAVGAASAGEVLIHWDGTTWTRVGPSGGIPDVNPLQSITIIGPRQRPQAAWQEVVN